MKEYRIVFMDGLEMLQRADSYTLAKVLAAYERMLSGVTLPISLIVDDEQSKIIGCARHFEHNQAIKDDCDVKTTQVWGVKDSSGEIVYIEADNLDVSNKRLEFYKDGVVVAAFVYYQSFWVAEMPRLS